MDHATSVHCKLLQGLSEGQQQIGEDDLSNQVTRKGDPEPSLGTPAPPTTGWSRDFTCMRTPTHTPLFPFPPLFHP